MLAFVAAGALVAVTHRVPPAPQLDTEGPAILSGCVVAPSALSAGRDQFLLELEPGARVRISLYVPDGKQAPVLRYGQRVEFDARVRATRNFNNPGASIMSIIWRARTFTGRRRRGRLPPLKCCPAAADLGS
jgi:hypothetical protein